ncbi:MAG: hypothetical protein LLF83_08700 [Methanobacterium sp.]|nr:hypothetical protein [Methanobacterium sp.]
MIEKSKYRPRIHKITLELKYKHQMEIVEEAWKLFNWAYNEKLRKQIKLNDLMKDD